MQSKSWVTFKPIISPKQKCFQAQSEPATLLAGFGLVLAGPGQQLNNCNGNKQIYEQLTSFILGFLLYPDKHKVTIWRGHNAGNN